jgi:hypothetical protein
MIIRSASLVARSCFQASLTELRPSFQSVRERRSDSVRRPLSFTTLVAEPTGGPRSVTATHRHLPCPRRTCWFSTRRSTVRRFPAFRIGTRSTPISPRPYNRITSRGMMRFSPPSWFRATGAPDATVVSSASFRTETGIAPGSFASAFGTFPSGDPNLLVNGEASKLVAVTTPQLVFVIPADAPSGQLRGGRSHFGNVPGAKNSLFRHFKSVFPRKFLIRCRGCITPTASRGSWRAGARPRARVHTGEKLRCKCGTLV